MVELEEKIRALRLIFGHKDELLQLLAKGFRLSLPATAPYERIVQRIVDAGLEQKFCQDVFHANSFDEGVSVLTLSLGLGILSRESLWDLASRLSDSARKWRFGKKSNRQTIDAIVRNCSRDEVEEGIRRLIRDDRLDPVQQHHQWVIGPLGITQSVCKRGAMRSEMLVAFLSKHVDASICEEILEMSEFLTPTKLETSLLQPKTIQLLLTYGTDENIFRVFNQLLDTGRLRIETREDYWEFYATPAGVFEETYGDPVGELAIVIASHLSEETVRKELRLGEGDLRLQIMTKCLNESPDAILERLFGMPDLRKIARGVGLVAIDSLSDKKALVELLLLKLGFSVPNPPQGLMYVRRLIETDLRDLETLDLPGRVGRVTSAYVQLERLLKDLVFFYVSILWVDEIEYVDEDELEVLNDFVTLHFKIRRPVSRLTFGELVGLLERVGEETNRAEKQRTVLSERFGREKLLVGVQSDLLGELSARRKLFAHHVSRAVTSDDCKNVLHRMLELVRDLDVSGVYPKLVLITAAITNQYGIRLLRAVDEESMPWTIKSDEYWISPAQHCFLVAETPGVAIDPTIVRRLWEPHG